MVSKSTLLFLVLISSAFVVLLASLKPIIPDRKTNPYVSFEPTPTVTPSPTVTPWKTFINGTYNYKFDHPSDWVTNSHDSTLINFGGSGFGFEVFIRNSNNCNTLQKCFNLIKNEPHQEQLGQANPCYTNPYCSGLWKVTSAQVTFMNLPALKANSIKFQGIETESIFFFHENYFYELRATFDGARNQESSRILSQVISSFAFESPLPYRCPVTEWINCIPSFNSPKLSQCDPEFLRWAIKSCPNFKGAAL